MFVSQLILVVLCGISLLMAANMHGKPKTGNHNFWVSAVAVALNIVLLYYAGALSQICK